MWGSWVRLIAVASTEPHCVSHKLIHVRFLCFSSPIENGVPSIASTSESDSRDWSILDTSTVDESAQEPSSSSAVLKFAAGGVVALGAAFFVTQRRRRHSMAYNRVPEPEDEEVMESLMLSAV